MSHISKISIKNYRGIQNLTYDFGEERFIVLLGRGDSGKSTILSAIYSVLTPSWNLAFSDLDFYNQDTTKPIEIELTLNELPKEFIKEQKFGLYLQNNLDVGCQEKDLTIVIKLTVDETLEPHWVVKAKPDSANDDKPISGTDRALLAVNYISDYTDNQFSYNKQSPLYALTKASLDEGVTIERVKSQLLRLMSDSIDESKIEPLNAPLEELKKTAEMLGLTVSELSAKIDVKENPYTGNSIALHNDSLPYRLQGKGSKRLMSIAIQSELTKQGGIVMVDELEQGLEPDRIITLVRKLKETKEGQVFITTHSLNVVLEADWHNILVLNKGADTLCKTPEELDKIRRSNPQALFAKKIICCEGRTEYGFMRAIDSLLCSRFHTTFSAYGVVLLESGGGDKMYSYARKLHELGFDTCVFADDDKSSDLKNAKSETIAAKIPLFLCEEGNCLEQQLFNDLSWECMPVIIKCDQEDFPKENILLPAGLEERISAAATEEAQTQIRNELASMSIVKNKEWFKHIPGGEFLGQVFGGAFDDMGSEVHSKKTICELLKWCGVNV